MTDEWEMLVKKTITCKTHHSVKHYEYVKDAPVYNINRIQDQHYNLSHSIDLHGYNVEKAFNLLFEFLSAHCMVETRRVLIITGRQRSDTVIPQEVRRWLLHTSMSCYVKYYQYAKPKEGGEGALSVFLNRKNC